MKSKFVTEQLEPFAARLYQMLWNYEPHNFMLPNDQLAKDLEITSTDELLKDPMWSVEEQIEMIKNAAADKYSTQDEKEFVVSFIDRKVESFKIRN